MPIKDFRGLNTVTDAMRLGMRWLVRADNVVVTNVGALAKREGYAQTLTSSAFTAYATNDQERMYVVDAGALKAMTGPASSVTIRTGITTREVHWAEVNGQVFFSTGIDSGVILPDNSVIPWAWPVPTAPSMQAVTGGLAPGRYHACCTFMLPDGRETGPSDVTEFVVADGQALQLTGIPQAGGGTTTNVYISPADSTVMQFAGAAFLTTVTWNASPDALGADLSTAFMHPLPDGCGPIQMWKGRAYAAQYMPGDDQTVLWFSQPLGYHLFDLAEDYIVLPGQVHMMAPHASALVIGTDRAVHAYTGEALSALADYGVPPGHHWSQDDDRTLFWTKRGLCAAVPFTNLTEGQVSVAPGSNAGGTVVRSGGQKRYVVALRQGGQAFNSRT